MRLISNDKRQLMLCKKNIFIILSAGKNFWAQWVYKYFNTSRRVSLRRKECCLRADVFYFLYCTRKIGDVCT